MNRAAAVALLLILVASTAGTASPDPAAAHGFPSPCLDGNDRRFVYDYLGLLDDVEGGQVEGEACRLYQEDGAHLVLVVVANLGGESIDQYAVHLVRDWGIGDDDRLDGLLLLYTADDGFGREALRVEVGYGLEGTINSIVARQVVDSVADVKRQQMENGSSEADATAHALAAGASGLALFTRTNFEGTAQETSRGGGFGIPWWTWLVLAVVLLSLFSRRGRGSGFLGGMILGGMMRRGGGGGGWGGRRGGGFGGGKSGGGGWNGRL